MKSVSISGKNWIFKKYNQEDIRFIKENFSLDEITSKLLSIRKIKKEDIINSYQEIKRDLKNYELEMRIEELEAKFSKDFNETTFNELKELKKLQKTN